MNPEGGSSGARLITWNHATRAFPDRPMWKRILAQFLGNPARGKLDAKIIVEPGQAKGISLVLSVQGTPPVGFNAKGLESGKKAKEHG
jgi:hypothetical protein